MQWSGWAQTVCSFGHTSPTSLPSLDSATTPAEEEGTGLPHADAKPQAEPASAPPGVNAVNSSQSMQAPANDDNQSSGETLPLSAAPLQYTTIMHVT